MKRFVLAVLLCTILAGCGSGGRNPPALSNGQSEAEVTAILGKPIGRMEHGRRTVLLYAGGNVELLDGKTVNLDAGAADRFAKAQEENERRAAYEAEQRSKGLLFFEGKWISPEEQDALQKKREASASTAVVRDRNGDSVDHSDLTVPGMVTVVDFYATWCGPCRRLAPVLEAMTAGDPEVVLRKVDIGNWESPLVGKYNIPSVPNVRVFDRKGRLVAPPASNSDTIRRNIEQAKKQ
jgi:thiol-disulfide isomerase/thioredoxin